MKRSTLLSATALALAGVIASPLTLGATATLAANVTRTLVSADTSFGGCMASLSADPASVLPTCGANWVSFSCTGDFTDKVRAYHMLDQAQLALAANKRVSVKITDASLHSGYCFVLRIDVLR